MTGSTPNAKSMPDVIKEKVRNSEARVEHTAAEVERSASATQRSAAATQRAAVATQQSVDRNTQLAADRTVLAAERTYAAWVRTGLAALVSGVGARALLAGTLPGWFGALTGSGLVLFSAFCFTAAVWRELAFGVPPPPADIQRLPIALLLTINGFLLLISLAALVGIWLFKA
jgi:putative membrane protein